MASFRDLLRLLEAEHERHVGELQAKVRELQAKVSKLCRLLNPIDLGNNSPDHGGASAFREPMPIELGNLTEHNPKSPAAVISDASPPLGSQ